MHGSGTGLILWTADTYSGPIASLVRDRSLAMVKDKVLGNEGIVLKGAGWHLSGRTCACCGHKHDARSLQDRYWKCPEWKRSRTGMRTRQTTS